MTQFTKNKKGTDSTVQSLVDILCNQSFENNSLLLNAVLGANEKRQASFHMPGHKSRLDFISSEKESCSAYVLDTTELNGLDDLTFPEGPILSIEKRLAEAYRVKSSLLSLGGASHGLIACILSVSKPGGYLLVPRSAHRSVINAVVLSGIDLVWYDPVWEKEWQFWGASTPGGIESALAKDSNCCGVLVVSPTFPGAISDINAIAKICHKFKTPLIVDEAHGAHFLPDCNLPRSAVLQGADLVVHSMHKTLTGLTQLGVIHVPPQSLVSDSVVRSSLRLVTSSSPSYPLMISAEQVSLLVNSVEFCKQLNEIKELCDDLRVKLKNKVGLEVFTSSCGVDPFHISLRMKGFTGVELLNYFESKGVFAESNLGSGCLLLAGSGSTICDFEKLLDAIDVLELRSEDKLDCIKPVFLKQAINPKEAYFSPFELVNAKDAIGRIAQECIAPCPPGVPVLSPGALVPEEIAMFDSMLGKVRVIKE